MRSRRMIAGLLVLVLLLVSGCWDATTPEQMAWVSALGVDSGPADSFRFTFQIMVPKELTTSGATGAKGQGENTTVLTVEAPDVITAVEMTDAFVARRVTLQHAKALVLGEDVVRHGISRFIAPAVRFRDFRRTVYVMVAKGTAKEFLEHARPRLETNPSLYYEMMMHWQEQTQLIPPIRLHDLVIAQEREGVGTRAALVSARPDLKEQDGEMDRGSGEEKGSLSPSRFFAGSLPRAGGISVEFLGTACFRGDMFVGFLTGQQTRLVGLLRGDLHRQTPVAVPDPLHPGKTAIMLLRMQQRPYVTLRRNGTVVTANFTLELEGDIGAITSENDYTEPEGMAKLERATEQYLRRGVEDILRLTLNEWGVDLYELGDRMKSQFLTMQEWQQFNWSEHVTKTQWTITLHFAIRRHGLQKAPAHPAR